jgi:hypothetical protein
MIDILLVCTTAFVVAALLVVIPQPTASSNY